MFQNACDDPDPKQCSNRGNEAACECSCHVGQTAMSPSQREHMMQMMRAGDVEGIIAYLRAHEYHILAFMILREEMLAQIADILAPAALSLMLEMGIFDDTPPAPQQAAPFSFFSFDTPYQKGEKLQ